MRITALVLVIVYFIVLLVIVGVPQAHARAFRSAPLPYSCDQVRWAYANFTPEHLRQLGKKMGVSLTGAQMREAQNCLKKA